MGKLLLGLILCIHSLGCMEQENKKEASIEQTKPYTNSQGSITLLENRTINIKKIEETDISDFSGISMNGSTIKFIEYRGKIVLLNLWATWCAPCRREIAYLEKLYKKYKKSGVEVVGISLDRDQDLLRFWLNIRKITYPIVWGNNKTAQFFGELDNIPTSFLIDKHGKIHKVYPGAPADPNLFEDDVKKLLQE